MEKKKEHNLYDKNVAALYEENIQLRSDKHIDSAINIEATSKFNKWNLCDKKCWRMTALVLVIFLLFICLGLISALFNTKFAEMFKPLEKGLKVQLAENSFRMTAQRYDDRIQDCQGNSLKMAFPDLNYALFGYNILFGYPLAVGHDPGLTHPIFAADYSGKKQTADCHYFKPRGYNLAPDVSCVTSFTSKVIQDSSQFEKSLSTSAEVSGGGWGVSFSASAQYKKKVSVMSSSESVFIMSEAKCNYYFALMDEINPPPLDQSFIDYAKRLHTKEDLNFFFDYYGTHYLTYVLFGARFVYEHKMSKESYKKESSSEVDVSVKASYSGLFSVGGGFGMSSKQKQAAQSFQENVETTTISIGSPPPESGGTTKWASTVKDTPVPVKYKLNSVENLFTKKYMQNTGIDYQKLYTLIKNGKSDYCKYLLGLKKIDSCNKFAKDYTKFKADLGATWYNYFKGSLAICTNTCAEKSKCLLIKHQDNYCYMYSNGSVSAYTGTSDVAIFLDKLKILDLKINVTNLMLDNNVAKDEVKNVDSEECMKKCSDDKICAASTYQRNSKKCLLFQQTKIMTNTFKIKDGAVTVFQP